MKEGVNGIQLLAIHGKGTSDVGFFRARHSAAEGVSEAKTQFHFVAVSLEHDEAVVSAVESWAEASIRNEPIKLGLKLRQIEKQNTVVPASKQTVTVVEMNFEFAGVVLVGFILIRA